MLLLYSPENGGIDGGCLDSTCCLLDVVVGHVEDMQLRHGGEDGEHLWLLQQVLGQVQDREGGAGPKLPHIIRCLQTVAGEQGPGAWEGVSTYLAMLRVCRLGRQDSSFRQVM